MTARTPGAGWVNSLLGVDVSPVPGSMSRGRILVIDDEPGILGFISRGLRGEGYAVEPAADGVAGLEASLHGSYDLVILDLLLPGMGGMDVLRRLMARKPDQRVIVLSALSDTPSKVTSLELGAEDYLAKPFSFDELLARIRARLRDGRPTPVTLAAEGFTMDLIRREVTGDFGRVLLAEREFLLLRELMGAAGTTVTKEHLLASVWGYHFDPGSNVVDVYVRRLRAKLGTDSIKTVRGEGYRVDAA
jgi:DNA-binding response OmpR family regulator